MVLSDLIVVLEEILDCLKGVGVKFPVFLFKLFNILLYPPSFQVVVEEILHRHRDDFIVISDLFFTVQRTERLLIECRVKVNFILGNITCEKVFILAQCRCHETVLEEHDIRID